MQNSVWVKLAVVILIGGVFAAGLAGCASTKNTSDVPWNVPQPWEGAPSIPGSP